MNGVTGLVAEIRAFRPFLPAKEFETSLRFYKAIGFEVYPLGETLAELSLGTHAFLLQGDYVKEWAENTVMHVLVKDVNAWWRHIESLALTRQFGVSPPAPPRVEPWGLTVAYLSDPSGVLWHFAQTTVENPNPGTTQFQTESLPEI
ncbi:MAG: hypothetical protein WCC21_16880 [Candidatus Acidiferrales bacterium]